MSIDAASLREDVEASADADRPDGAFVSWTDWTCTVALFVEEPSRLDEASAIVRSVMADVEQAASRFRTDSEVMALSDGDVHLLSPTLRALLLCALDAAEATDGAIDPTLGAVMTAWGYADAVPTETVRTPTIEVSRRATWRDVVVDLDVDTVQVPAGVVVDLGATAKAWAADTAADRIAEELATSCVVGIGGDLAVRCADGRRLPIAVAESEGANGDLLLFGAGGVATSTTTCRRWATTGADAHHVMDPFTCRPVEGPWRTATVAAASCAAANHAATAALVKGAGAVRWLEGLALPARLVAQDGTVVSVGAWPEEDPTTTEEVA
jgi:thiamine biosynthesis lipoprotein